MKMDEKLPNKVKNLLRAKKFLNVPEFIFFKKKDFEKKNYIISIK